MQSAILAEERESRKSKRKGKKEHGVFSLIQDLSNIFPAPVYFRTKLP